MNNTIEAANKNVKDYLKNGDHFNMRYCHLLFTHTTMLSEFQWELPHIPWYKE